eukprot:Seg2940.1 transcript_id=Seg2940.1/GoldUCD/mRNA.D3Y31 product="hypothetical protein" protein_id=Seg2940.1/GoldUCD/D3Y31
MHRETRGLKLGNDENKEKDQAIKSQHSKWQPQKRNSKASESLIDTMLSPKMTPRADSAASEESGRCTDLNQSYLRSYGMQPFERQTMITTKGFRTVKIYTTADGDKNSMRKYRPRPKTALGIMTSKTDGNEGKLNSKNESLLKRSSSAKELRQNKAGPEAKEKRPGTAVSPSTSSQSSNNPSIIYNSRHPACTPSHLYMKDNIRAQAKKNRPRSAPYDCEDCSSVERYNTVQRRRTKSADVATRFGTAVRCPNFVKDSEFLTHDDLDMGQKQYIWGTARIYSVDQLKLLRQRHYQSILNYEYMKRVTTRGVKEKQRVKLWKEYEEYQKAINRFGKGGKAKSLSSLGSHWVKNHSHAKKHRIVGWTTDLTDDESNRGPDYSAEEFDEASFNEESLIFSEDGSGTTEDETLPMLKEKQSPDSRPFGKDRPKSCKYKIRRPAGPTPTRHHNTPENQKETEEMATYDIKVEETLSGEVQDKLSIQDNEEENFL